MEAQKTVERVASKGRIVEVLAGPDGWEGVRNTLVDEIVRAQAADEIAAYVDVRHVGEDQDLDLQHARDRGVDCARLLVSVPDCISRALEVVEALIRSGSVELVVLAGMNRNTPIADRELRKLSALLRQTNGQLVIGRT